MGFKTINEMQQKTSAERMKALLKENELLQTQLAKANSVIESNPQFGSFEKTSKLLSELRREVLSKVQSHVSVERWDDCRRDILFVLGNRFGEKKLNEIFKVSSPKELSFQKENNL
ncbi:MAG: hypothetical protein JNM39_16390 [Bdellovibrionaceae bacterium]|nr:hypothetical protein [Pseudobdellovibrionaceae bacterium]